MALHQDEAQARSELLLRDAEEALQRERLQAFWRQWGATLIGMCVMLVIGTGAGVAWRQYRLHQNEQSTSQLLAIMTPATPGALPPAMTDAAAKKMTDTHAAIGWLIEAGKAEPTDTKALEQNFANAAKQGGDAAWGWLGSWNALRLRMDDPQVDAEKLIGQMDDLAGKMGRSQLAALPLTDAAVLAGERLGDSKKALDFLDRAEKLTPRSTPMAVMIADLQHLYHIRNQTDVKPAEAKQ